jgi:hypothetical protein
MQSATDIISGENGQVSYKSTKTTPPPLPAAYEVQDASKQRKSRKCETIDPVKVKSIPPSLYSEAN